MKPPAFNYDDYIELKAENEKLKKEIADAEPVKHGHWYYDQELKEIKCSRCHIGIPYDIDGYACSVSKLMKDDKYCYNCGAKMDEVSK